MGAVHKVLAQIPGFRFEEVRSRCRGMAGSFGLEAEHAELSLALAPAQRPKAAIRVFRL